MSRRPQDPRRTSPHRRESATRDAGRRGSTSPRRTEALPGAEEATTASASGSLAVPSAGSADPRQDGLYNPPGQRRLRFRVGTQSSFYRRMVAQLPEETLPDGPAMGNRPLRRLTTRDPQDPTLALLWAFAGVGDILTFYQQEILNEGYVGTASERLSLVELSRLVGYEPTPPVSAEALLAFSAEETEDETNPDEYPVPVGTAVVSTPEGEGELPQTFETSDLLTARSRWNSLRPQQTRRQPLRPGSTSLWLAGVDTGLESASRLLLVRRGVDRGGEARFAWRELVVQEVVAEEDESGEAPELERTFVRWDGALGFSFFWIPPEGQNLPEVEVYALRESASLFGYDVPPWSSQPWEVKVANTPPGFVPQDFDDWPGLELDLDQIDLDAEYPSVISGGWMVLERPAAITVVEAGVVTTVNRNAFTLSGQVTRVRPALTATVPCGTTLVPPRQLATVTRLPDGRVLVAGGLGAPQQGLQRAAKVVPEPLSSVQILDPVNGTVTATGSLQQARSGHSATLLADNTVLVIGGIGRQGKSLASAELYHLEGEFAGTFTAVTSHLPVSRTAHTATLLPDGQVLVAGGLEVGVGTEQVLQVCALYDPSTKSFFGPTQPFGVRPKPLVLQQGRAWHSATVLPATGARGPRVLVAGGVGAKAGVGEGLGEALETAELYDPVPELFLETASMASARSHHTASVVVTAEEDGDSTTRVLVAGGRATQERSEGGSVPMAVASLESFDGESEAWSDAGFLEQGRFDHSATALADGSVVLAGGTTLVWLPTATEPVPETLATVEAWLPAVNAPRRRESLAEPRTRHGAVLLADGWMVLAGGWRGEPSVAHPEAGVPLGSIDFYQPRSATFIAAGSQPFDAFASAISPLTSGSVLVAGGFGTLVVGADGDRQPARILRAAAVFDPHTNLYTSVAHLHTARSGAAATLLPGGQVLVSGGVLAVVNPQVEALKKALDEAKASLEAAEAPLDDLDTQADIILENVANVRKQLYDNKLSVSIDAYYVAWITSGGHLSWNVNGLVQEKGSKSYYYSTSESFSKRYSDILNPVLNTSLTAMERAAYQIRRDTSEIQGYFDDAMEAIDAALAIVADLSKGEGLFAAELYDPESRAFSPAANPMVYYRAGHTSTLLPDGRVLLAGGIGFPWSDLPDAVGDGSGEPGIPMPMMKTLASAEVYDPFTGEFTEVGRMTSPRIEHTATALADGRVLVAGGSDGSSALATAQVFDPVTLTFNPIAGAMTQARVSATATLLPGGSVLVAGGSNGSSALASSEVFDPLSLTFSPRGSLDQARQEAVAQLLPDGRVLVAGGNDGLTENLASAELYVEGRFVPTGSLITPRSRAVVATVPGGDVLVSGGIGTDKLVAQRLSSAERYVARAQRQQPNEIPGTAVWLDSEPLPLARVPLEIPMWGDRLVVEGEEPQLAVGQQLLISGRRPLVRYSDPFPLETEIAEIGEPGESTQPGESGTDEWTPVLTAFTGSPRRPILPGQPLTLLRAPWASSPGIQYGEEPTRDGALPAQDPGIFGEEPLNLRNEHGFAGYTATEAASFVVEPAPENVREVAEAAVIRLVGEPQDGLTEIWLEAPLYFVYDRRTVSINGNVVAATQGAGSGEVVLGSGDGSLRNQVFRLPEGPLTRLSDLSPAGFLDALEIRVDDVLWQPVDELFTAGPLDQVYTVQQSFRDQTEIIFGDGVHGARLPSGEENVVAVYRIGAGVSGNVGAGTLTQLPSPPPGIAAVTNPMAAAGGASGEAPRELRDRLPLRPTDLGRIIAVEDFRSFALSYAGVAKANSAIGRPWGVDAMVSVVPREEPKPQDFGPDGRRLDEEELEGAALFQALDQAMAAAVAPGITYRLLAAGVQFFNLELVVLADPRYDLESLERTLRATLLALYGFHRRDLGEGLSASEILSTVQMRPEIHLVDLDALYYSGQERERHPFLPARPPSQPADGRAHLLLVNPEELRIVVEAIDS
ncbi:MAG: kelch repeat-containing protein [Acidobacteriota bacterium]